MYPGLRPLTPGTEPEDFGYISEEYFVSGMAAGQPYKTRILIRRPEKPQKFSGVVVSEVLHSNGFAVTFEPGRKSVLVRGHVQMDIAGQVGNVNTIRAFNPDRYASLQIASGAQTSEIVAQVGGLIRSNLRGGPLDPLSTRTLVLLGTSQSSGVLRSYQSQQHFQARMPDGGPIFQGYLAVSTLGSAQMLWSTCLPSRCQPRPKSPAARRRAIPTADQTAMHRRIASASTRQRECPMPTDGTPSPTRRACVRYPSATSHGAQRSRWD
jgi:hypothetical protein